MKDVVIFGDSAAGSVLALVRNIRKFFKVNTYVICLNSNYSSVFNASRFVTEAVEILGLTDSELLETYKIWVDNKKFQEKPILYFTTDNSCLFVNNNREWFESNFELTIPSSKIINTYNFKGVAEFDAAKNGLLVPKTINIISSDNIKTVIDSFCFPVIIKPTSALTKKKAGFKVKIFEDKFTFQHFTESLLNEDKPVICQEYIPGGDDKAIYHIFYRNEDGIIHENIGVKKLQSPPSQGIMSIGVSRFNEQVSVLSKSFLEKISYTGIGGIEFKEHNGDYYFIEMSTRLEGFFLISEISGMPISKISYLDYSKITCEMGIQQTDEIKYIDLISFTLTRIKQRKYFLLFKEFLFALFDKNTFLNVFIISDVRPFFVLAKGMLDNIIRKIRFQRIRK